jgi:hypothetical protein
MVDLLDLAERAGVTAELAVQLQTTLDAGALPDIDALRERFLPPRAAQMPQVTVVLPAAAVYDRLLEVAA